MESRLRHLEKACHPIDVKVFGIFIFFKLIQPVKVIDSMIFKFSGRLMDSKLEQSLKTELSMVVIVSGRYISFKLLQRPNVRYNNDVI
ncbi:MAG: hypothetical protein K2K32_03940, partial [Muribaculaceae bacterium]|nr:hypothetical protein [Muribaculaceae bacterium]